MPITRYFDRPQVGILIETVLQTVSINLVLICYYNKNDVQYQNGFLSSEPITNECFIDSRIIYHIKFVESFVEKPFYFFVMFLKSSLLQTKSRSCQAVFSLMASRLFCFFED